MQARARQELRQAGLLMVPVQQLQDGQPQQQQPPRQVNAARPAVQRQQQQQEPNNNNRAQPQLVERPWDARRAEVAMWRRHVLDLWAAREQVEQQQAAREGEARQQVAGVRGYRASADSEDEHFSLG